jgi:hypothetical protein
VRRAAVAAAFAIALGVVGTAGAYNDDPEADAVFSPWLAAEPASPDRRFMTASVFYEIHAGALHDADVHLRNVTSRTLHFDWWLAGRQKPGDNVRVTLPPFFETREEVRLHVPLRNARPGLDVARMLLYDVRQGLSDTGTPAAALPATLEDAEPADDWMQVDAVRDDVVVRRAGLLVRFERAVSGLTAVFHNSSSRDLHFEVDVPGGDAPADSRVHVGAGKDAVVPLAAAPSSFPPALLRVFVHDVRVGDDTGRLYAEDRRRDAGWFPLETSDGSAPLPKEGLLSKVEPSKDGAAIVRFRSRLRTTVRFRFSLPGRRADDHVGEIVELAPGGETEVVAKLDRPADASLVVARVRVTEVAHRENP